MDTNSGPKATDLAYEIVNNDIIENNTSQYEMINGVDYQSITVTKKRCYNASTTPEQLTTISNESPSKNSSQNKTTGSGVNMSSTLQLINLSTQYNKKKLIIVLILLSCIIGILFVILSVTAAFGFARLSEQGIDQHTVKHDQCQNNRFNESVIDITETNKLDLDSKFIHLLFHNNLSYLQDILYANNEILSLAYKCIKNRQFTFIQCINSVLTIYGKKLWPAKSCKELQTVTPHISGYYWVKASDGSIIQVYCDMTESCGNMTGGLTRIATLNMNTRSQYCTGVVDFDRTGCFKKSPLPGCSGFVFNSPNLNLSYTHICGTIEGGYFGWPEGFTGTTRSFATIDDNYVDGVSLTYGSIYHRTHIWTFGACIMDNCSANVPQFVGNHYSPIQRIGSHSAIMFQRNFLPLLDENIEVRLCQDENRNNPDYEGLYLITMNIYVN